MQADVELGSSVVTVGLDPGFAATCCKLVNFGEKLITSSCFSKLGRNIVNKSSSIDFGLGLRRDLVR